MNDRLIPLEELERRFLSQDVITALNSSDLDIEVQAVDFEIEVKSFSMRFNVRGISAIIRLIVIAWFVLQVLILLGNSGSP